MDLVQLIILFILCVVQNMAFTFVSRSRNSADLSRHAVAAVFSNGIWFAVNYFLIFPQVMDTIAQGAFLERVVVMLVYVAGTVIGSVLMMATNLGKFGDIPFLTEKGKGQVGAR